MSALVDSFRLLRPRNVYRSSRLFCIFTFHTNVCSPRIKERKRRFRSGMKARGSGTGYLSIAAPMATIIGALRVEPKGRPCYRDHHNIDLQSI